MPSRPGVELTSNNKGPRLDCNISTPQTGNFKARDALIAKRNSSGLSFIMFADPPLCKFDRNSPSVNHFLYSLGFHLYTKENVLAFHWYFHRLLFPRK